MPTIARTIGPAGSGKTTDALETMEKVFATGIADPLRVGFVSFTRAARQEAAVKAAKKFGGSPIELEKSGWFKTLHAICFRQLGIQPGELLTGSAEDNAWLKDVLGDEKAALNRNGADDEMFAMPSEQGESSIALALWSAARNRLVPLADVWERAHEGDSRTPDLAVCESVVTIYEAAKQRAGRLDFTDLLMRFAGKSWSRSHAAPFADVDPQGDDPGLPVWVIDEAQDTSLLASLVFGRLIRFAQWVYVYLDMWQELYRFAGADGRIFGECAVAKEKVLPISYRCPSNILKFSDDIMLRGGHSPRDCRSHRKGGDIVRTELRQALSSVRADQDTLIIARTNEYAKHAASLLDDSGVPWIPTKGGGGFNAPARADGVAALVALRKGQGIDGLGVHRMMELLPVNADGTRLFEPGAKAFYADKESGQQSHKLEPITMQYLADAGCTRAFKELLTSGRYVELLEKPAARMARAAEIHGIGAVLKPKIRVGTCHSCKGMEAEHVVAINRIPFPTQRAIESEEGMDEERRVWYVSASRAKEKLTIADPDQGEPFPEL